MVAILVIFVPPFAKMQEKRSKNTQYEEKIRQLKEKQVRLLEERRLLEEDPEYLEKVAREKMGIAREGEVIYRITPINAEIDKK